MMQLAALFLALIAGAGASELHEMGDIKADSALGMRLLAEARQLDGTSYASTWVSGYSLKFEGCHQISQWNDQVDSDTDVRIDTKRLVRFRLCPTDFCDSNKGCSNGYGDYIIDMDSYLAAWFEAKQAYQSFQCDYLTNNVCDCADDTDDYPQVNCQYDCYAAHSMAGICMDYNPYGDTTDSNTFSLYDYMTCSKLSVSSSGRELSDSSSWNGYYYVGPYCASQGGAIYLGLFTDDTCTAFADTVGGRQTYYSLKGTNLPYGQTNVVDMDCMSCKEPSENNVDGDDASDADDVTEACETIYTVAGKCEANLPYGTVFAPNNNACNYMEGIKIVRKDGTVVSASARANKTASVFIGIFVVSFVLLSAYVYFLKTKLDRASINLSSE